MVCWGLCASGINATAVAMKKIFVYLNEGTFVWMDAFYECSMGSSASKASSLRFLVQDFIGGRTMSLKRKVP